MTFLLPPRLLDDLDLCDVTGTLSRPTSKTLTRSMKDNWFGRLTGDTAGKVVASVPAATATRHRALQRNFEIWQGVMECGRPAWGSTPTR